MPRDKARDKPRACFWAHSGVVRCIGGGLLFLAPEIVPAPAAST
jgi:hypothetical protein